MIDAKLPTHCPFCKRIMTIDRGYTGCYANREVCPYMFEHYTDETEAYYDIYVPMSNDELVFQSTMYEGGIGLSELYSIGIDNALASIHSYTEPTAEAIETIVNRMKKLLVFS